MKRGSIFLLKVSEVIMWLFLYVFRAINGADLDASYTGLTVH